MDIREILEKCDHTLLRVDCTGDRNYWMTADEALQYGMVDRIMKKK